MFDDEIPNLLTKHASYLSEQTRFRLQKASEDLLELEHLEEFQKRGEVMLRKLISLGVQTKKLEDGVRSLAEWTRKNKK